MKRIVFSLHAREQLALRGGTEAEAQAAILEGEGLPGRTGQNRVSEELPFPF
jgi:hypothetical protein